MATNRVHRHRLEDEKIKTQPRGIVVIGGGIVGLTTAYFLALALSDEECFAPSTNSHHKPPTTIIESSDRLCPAASSQATGNLGYVKGEPSKVGWTGLNWLSYKLHVELAKDFNGKDEYGWSDQTLYRIQKKGSSDKRSPPDDYGSDRPPVPVPASHLPVWVRMEDDWEAYRLSSPPHSSHLDPRRFAAGPWSDRVFSTLFPDAKVKLAMDSRDAAGNHARIMNLSGAGEDSAQVYFTNVTSDGSRFDVTSFPNGYLYIGGWGAVAEDVPPLATMIKPQPAEIADMIAATKKFVKVDMDKPLEYHDAGRCYRPKAVPNRPVIGKVPLHLLYDKLSTKRSGADHHEGLYINTGHHSDGIALSLGSGKLISQMILGLPLSVDISSLGLLGTL